MTSVYYVNVQSFSKGPRQTTSYHETIPHDPTQHPNEDYLNMRNSFAVTTYSYITKEARSANITECVKGLR